MSTRLHLPHAPHRPSRARTAVQAPATVTLEPKALVEAEAPLQPGAPTSGAPLTHDVDACKVREAGGPLDEAAYVCLCGFAFAAAVSTSVECPHCGAAQAW